MKIRFIKNIRRIDLIKGCKIIRKIDLTSEQYEQLLNGMLFISHKFSDSYFFGNELEYLFSFSFDEKTNIFNVNVEMVVDNEIWGEMNTINIRVDVFENDYHCIIQDLIIEKVKKTEISLINHMSELSKFIATGDKSLFETLNELVVEDRCDRIYTAIKDITKTMSDEIVCEFIDEFDLSYFEAELYPHNDFLDIYHNSGDIHANIKTEKGMIDLKVDMLEAFKNPHGDYKFSFENGEYPIMKISINENNK